MFTKPLPGWFTAPCVAGALLLAGCAGPIDPSPFARWTEATASLAHAADAAAEALAERSRERFLAEGGAPAAALLLDRPDDPDGFGWRSGGDDVPLFMQAEQFAASLRELNAGLRDYAQALEMLASPTAVDPARLDVLAAGFNDHATAAAQALGDDDPPRDRVALFTVAARAAAEQYLRTRQRDGLVRVLVANQPAVAALSDRGRDAALLLLDAAWRDYSARSRGLDVAELAALNRAHVRELELLRELHDAYAALGGSHEALQWSIDRPGAPLDRIERLAEHARSLRSLYVRLREPGHLILDAGGQP